MDKRIIDYRLSEWARIVKAISESGLTKVDWCRRNKVSLRALYYWQKKLRDYALEHGEKELESMAERAVESGSPKTGSIMPSETEFYELNVSDADSSYNKTLLPKHFLDPSDLSIGYKGFSIHVNDSTPDETLLKVLMVMKNV